MLRKRTNWRVLLDADGSCLHEKLDDFRQYVYYKNRKFFDFYGEKKSLNAEDSDQVARRIATIITSLKELWVEFEANANQFLQELPDYINQLFLSYLLFLDPEEKLMSALFNIANQPLTNYIISRAESMQQLTISSLSRRATYQGDAYSSVLNGTGLFFPRLLSYSQYLENLLAPKDVKVILDKTLLADIIWDFEPGTTFNDALARKINLKQGYPFDDLSKLAYILYAAYQGDEDILAFDDQKEVFTVVAEMAKAFPVILPVTLNLRLIPYFGPGEFERCMQDAVTLTGKDTQKRNPRDVLRAYYAANGCNLETRQPRTFKPTVATMQFFLEKRGVTPGCLKVGQSSTELHTAHGFSLMLISEHHTHKICLTRKYTGEDILEFPVEIISGVVLGEINYEVETKLKKDRNLALDVLSVGLKKVGGIQLIMTQNRRISIADFHIFQEQSESQSLYVATAFDVNLYLPLFLRYKNSNDKTYELHVKMTKDIDYPQLAGFIRVHANWPAAQTEAYLMQGIDGLRARFAHESIQPVFLFSSRGELVGLLRLFKEKNSSVLLDVIVHSAPDSLPLSVFVREDSPCFNEKKDLIARRRQFLLAELLSQACKHLYQGSTNQSIIFNIDNLDPSDADFYECMLKNTSHLRETVSAIASTNYLLVSKSPRGPMLPALQTQVLPATTPSTGAVAGLIARSRGYAEPAATPALAAAAAAAACSPLYKQP